MKLLLTSLKVLKTSIRFKTQRLLQRPQPTKEQSKLSARQSPVGIDLESSGVESGGVGWDGVCQWVRASRSRERRSQ